MTDPMTLTASEALRRLDDRTLSSVELVGALLDRIERVNGSVNAIRVVLAEDALAGAAAADRRRAAGTPCGPLDGLPFSVKENVDVAGTATTQGAAALCNARATVDAPAVANLRRAGAIPLARTNLPDFALRWHTDSGIAGPTLNPWDPALTPGGSSGGEAVSLATGMSLLGVGNDLGGSLRFPSQCNGTAALRPTLGRVPHALSLEPTAKPLSLQLIEVQGPMARDVEDLRLAVEIMSRPDPRDPWHVPNAARTDGPQRVHLARRDAGDIDAPVAEALENAAAALAERGYELDDAGPPISEAAELWAPLMTADARRAWPDLEPLASPDGVQFMQSMFDRTPPLDLAAFGELFITRQQIARRWSEHHAVTPLVLAPISTRIPFRAGSDLDGPAATERIVASLQATLAVNVLGLPSVAVPAGVVDGLPQAVQIIGPRYGEELCLAAAALVQRTITPITPREPAPAASP